MYFYAILFVYRHDICLQSKEAFWICTSLVLTSNVVLIWMYVKSMTCSFQKSGCFIISIPINNSTRDTATEAPLPFKVTEAPISYNHSISVYIESFSTSWHNDTISPTLRKPFPVHGTSKRWKVHNTTF